jgi:hypothetical protein
MLNQLQEFAKATDQAMCKIFNDYGRELTALSTIALIAPPTFKVGVGIALAQTAARHGCNWDPDGEGPDGPPADGKAGCWKVDTLSRIYSDSVEPRRTGFANGSRIEYVQEILEVLPNTCFNDKCYPTIKFRRTNGEIKTEEWQGFGAPQDRDFQWSFYLDPEPEGGTCTDPNPVPPPPAPAPDTYVTEEGCTLIVNFEGWGQLPDGSIEPIMRIEPSAETKASGGVIGGCNFQPTIYYGGNGPSGPDGGGGGGGGGNGPVTVPYLPEPGDDGEPIWKDALQAALAGVAGAVVNQALDAALAKVYDGAIYRMEAPCDKDEDGNPLVWEKEIPPAPSTDALGYRLTAIHEQISQALAWKTPICNEKPELEGEWRTISFRSESSSPYGHARLRKRFRYRSTSGLGLGEIVDHWKDFSFESGPVVVCHSGSSWGTPQVWAATADEGKRVIRHAAGEAGIDPDQVGRWTISSSSSARYGVSDTMKVDTTGGYYWITARDGSDGRPMVATSSNPYGSGLDNDK